MARERQQPLSWQQRALRDRGFAFFRALNRRHPRARTYLVGGVVRDLLLGRGTKDVDLVVTGVPKGQLAALLQRFGRVDFVGRTFGVFKFTPRGRHGSEAMDVALPRLDEPGRGTGAYRDVRVVSKATLPIEKDLARRDYTVNAMAWSIDERRLVDPFQGQVDLKARLLRTVGDPAARFQEDYSRMLRGLRFAVTLGFEFERSTWRALVRMTKRLNDESGGQFVVPREVIAREFLKTFYADPVAAFALYDSSGAMRALIPEVEAMKRCPQPRRYHTEGSVWRHTELALAALASRPFRRRHPARPDTELIVAVLLHDIAKPTTLRTPGKHGVDRVRFDGHDVIGGRTARAVAERLRLATMPSDTPYRVDPENLDWLIQHHLLLLHGRPSAMKLATVVKYFVEHPLSEKLKALMLADTLGTRPPSGRAYTHHLVALDRILSRLPHRANRRLPPPLLNGEEIMTLLKIASGPLVGYLKRRLREEQLIGSVMKKRVAEDFIRREYARTAH